MRLALPPRQLGGGGDASGWPGLRPRRVKRWPYCEELAWMLSVCGSRTFASRRDCAKQVAVMIAARPKGLGGVVCRSDDRRRFALRLGLEKVDSCQLASGRERDGTPAPLAGSRPEPRAVAPDQRCSAYGCSGAPSLQRATGDWRSGVPMRRSELRGASARSCGRRGQGLPRAQCWMACGPRAARGATPISVPAFLGRARVRAAVRSSRRAAHELRLSRSAVAGLASSDASS